MENMKRKNLAGLDYLLYVADDLVLLCYRNSTGNEVSLGFDNEFEALEEYHKLKPWLGRNYGEEIL